jgi:hypothetical protein
MCQNILFSLLSRNFGGAGFVPYRGAGSIVSLATSHTGLMGRKNYRFDLDQSG